MRTTCIARLLTRDRADRPMVSRVLVLDGHSKASAEVVLALPTTCEIHVGAAKTQCLSFASRRVIQRLQQPESPDVLRTWLASRDGDIGYDLIVASTETSLTALKSQSLDASLWAKLVIPDESSIDIALSKHETWVVARQLGIKVPRSVLVRSADELPARPCFPLVIKPVTSKVMVRGKLQTLAARICTNTTEREAASRELLPHTPIVEQEYFRGRGVGVDVIFEHGALRWLFAHERIHEIPITGGASTYRRATQAPAAIVAAAVSLLEHLRWHGVAMVEFKVADDGDYRLLEINPRLWGALPLAVAAGVNFPRGLLQLARGQSLGEQPRYRRGLYMRDVAADLRWFAQSCSAPPSELTVKPLAPGDFVALLRPLVGMERWDLFRWRELELWIALSTRSLAALLASLRARWRRFPVAPLAVEDSDGPG